MIIDAFKREDGVNRFVSLNHLEILHGFLIDIALRVDHDYVISL